MISKEDIYDLGDYSVGAKEWFGILGDLGRENERLREEVSVLTQLTDYQDVLLRYFYTITLKHDHIIQPKIDVYHKVEQLKDEWERVKLNVPTT